MCKGIAFKMSCMVSLCLLLSADLVNAESNGCLKSASDSCGIAESKESPSHEGSSGQTVDASTAEADRSALFRKRILVQQLSETRRSLEKRFGIRINTSAVENFCLEKETLLSDCEQAVNALEERLIRRAKLEKALEEPQTEETKPQETNPTNVIVIQNDPRPIWIIKPRRPHQHLPHPDRRPDHHPGRNETVQPTPGQQQPVSTSNNNPFKPKSEFSDSLTPK